MPHVELIAREALEEYESFFQIAEQMMGGFVPNSLFTMAHRPDPGVRAGQGSRRPARR